MFKPGKNSWGSIEAATTAISDIAMGAESLSEVATPKVGVTSEAAQLRKCD
jgi:hypothetical protein